MATASYASGHAQPGTGGAMPPHLQHGGPGAAPVPDSYFTESRKGEINELRNLLRGFAAERDPQRKRDIIKKVRSACQAVSFGVA
jgi:AP-4 complex subunit beta-1